MFDHLKHIDMPTVSAPYIGAIIGIVIHHGLFIHGEWHGQAPYILVFHSVCFLCLAVLSRIGLQLITGYLLALFSSILIYRVFFHRLNDFPGPFGARVTKLWHLWKVRTSQNHFFLADLQRQYGDFVRTGPSEITVFHPQVFMAIDGPHSRCGKAEWYDLLHPFTKSLVTARTKDIHKARRHLWKQGFTSKALRDAKGQILSLIEQLDHCIQADITADRASEVSDLVYWLSFDRMAEFVLGDSFNMLSHQHWHHIILLLQRAMSILGPLSPTPWLVQLFFRLGPRVWVIKDWFTMMDWCESHLKQSKSTTDTSKPHSLAHYLLQDSLNRPTQETWLAGDSLLAFVAGSEPTAGVLIGLFYELAKNPEQAETIYREVLQHGQAHLHRCQHLKAAIYEALRLYPSLPTGGNRKTPPDEGITVAGVFIPPHTTVVAPKFCIGRSEISFEKPNQFIPERWTTKPEMVRDRSGFTPFGSGSHSCLGRALAMNDMLLITAHIVRRYRMRFPLGENGDIVFREWNDRFTSSLGRLRLVFEIRGGQQR
ncbi:hypothetical protein BDW75DRAFT_247861 [Aspergillus navahoensis]